jgi:hypothetical protein
MDRLKFGLGIAAAYHAVIGLALFVIPGVLLRAVQMTPALYAFSFHTLMFRLVGLLALTVAFGAYLLARGGARNADLAAVLLLAKLGGAAALLYYALRGEFVAFMLFMAIVNELIWAPLFAWVLRRAGRPSA